MKAGCLNLLYHLFNRNFKSLSSGEHGEHSGHGNILMFLLIKNNKVQSKGWKARTH